MSATRLKIFISSVQKEFAQQRSDLKAFLLGDAVLRRFVSEVFLFEEIPAKTVALIRFIWKKSSVATYTWASLVMNMETKTSRAYLLRNANTTKPPGLERPD